VNEHTHPPSQTKCEMKLLKNRIENRSQTTFDTTQRILTDELQGISATAAVNLPNVEHLRRTIRSQRHGAGNMLPKPVNRQAIPFLPLEHQQTSLGERFLLFDSEVDLNRIFIFGTDQALQLLVNSEDWFGDGTFKVCPEVFFKVYTVHAKIAERVLPCIYALLPNKQEVAYRQLFNRILAAVEPLDNGPSTMIFNFERAAINAAENVFENVLKMFLRTWKLAVVFSTCHPAYGNASKRMVYNGYNQALPRS